MNPTTVDDRFDQAEQELNRGEPWRYREPDAPNPLTIIVTGWATGHTRHGDAEFLTGTDRDGKAWSVLVGPKVLSRRLIEGEISEWDDSRGSYVVTAVQGRAVVGEVVSMRFLGDKESSSGRSYPDFAVSRKPAESGDVEITWETQSATAAAPQLSDDDIPY
jgi:hypothetical protein